nr:DUF2934 domain-containing protein [Bradyrhizobium sp. 61]
MWKAAGEPDGQAVEFWRRAENELLAERRTGARSRQA